MLKWSIMAAFGVGSKGVGFCGFRAEQGRKHVMAMAGTPKAR